MDLTIKHQTETRFRTDSNGYLIITQGERSVRLTAQQVGKLVQELQAGEWIELEKGWNEGIEGN